MHEKVLEIWTKIYSGELLQNDKEFDDKDELLRRIKDLLLQEDIRDEELPLSVVIRYAWWLTDQSPHDGVQVFIKSPRRYEMDSDEILEKLETYDEDIQKTYLEYLVLTENSKKSEYHTYLACSYVKDIQRILKDSKCLEEMKNTLEEFKRQVESTQKSANHFTFVDYLESQQSNFRFIKPRLLLIQLLEISQLYSPEILLNVLTEAGPLNIEKAVVYGRMNKHKEALDILIHELHDFVGAETYCVTNGKSLTLNKEKFEEEYLSTKQLNERRALFTMLFKSYIAINNRYLKLYPKTGQFICCKTF
ncbi:uncharacterized protein BX663DRAFT_442228 [Cokeromyces recurvatus]|uniref:uncharacterized protein n=1 Tax=Cokeromyces recurvatus TaxID=90255 RepID=UPI00222032D8|nr:uncharacterized protein BX663DRAFT_442228 [Cokeromyces recurvatus]KAI7898931.1 hypothetical protein BX663DRAFT_442228 [Cokeromyces recurvatus]